MTEKELLNAIPNLTELAVEDLDNIHSGTNDWTDTGIKVYFGPNEDDYCICDSEIESFAKLTPSRRISS